MVSICGSKCKNIHTYLRNYLPTYLPTYIHTIIYIYVYACVYIYTRKDTCTYIYIYRYVVKLFVDVDLHVFKVYVSVFVAALIYVSVPVHNYYSCFY